MLSIIRNSRGDTIVEVLIAVAIISSVITLSYTTASRALILGRRAQERTEALKLAESTVERIKSFAITDPVTFYDMKEYQLASYCLEPEGANIRMYEQKSVPQDTREDSLLTSSTGAPTGDAIYHENCAVGIDKRYKLSLNRIRLNDDQNEYTIRARWESLGGGQDEVKLVYRYHRSSTVQELVPPQGECPAGFSLGTRIISPEEMEGGLVEPPFPYNAPPSPAGLGLNNTDYKQYTFNSTSGTFYSQLVFRGTGAYPDDISYEPAQTGRNAFTIYNGEIAPVIKGPNTIHQVVFPGHDMDGDNKFESAADVPPFNRFYVSSGNTITDPFFPGRAGKPIEQYEYLHYGRRLTNLEPGTYVFYVYLTNTIELEHYHDSGWDPKIIVKQGGQPYDIHGTPLTPVLRLTEIDTSNSVNTDSVRSGWMRVSGVFTVDSSRETVIKFTDIAERFGGDDFGMTAIGVTRCDAN